MAPSEAATQQSFNRIARHCHRPSARPARGDPRELAALKYRIFEKPRCLLRGRWGAGFLAGSQGYSAYGLGNQYYRKSAFGHPIHSKNFDLFGSPSTGPELTLLVYGPNLAVAGWGDHGYRLKLSLPDLTAGSHTLALHASGSGWQGGGDESFAVDNITISARGVPEPTSPAPRLRAFPASAPQARYASPAA